MGALGVAWRTFWMLAFMAAMGVLTVGLAHLLRQRWILLRRGTTADGVIRSVTTVEAGDTIEHTLVVGLDASAAEVSMVTSRDVVVGQAVRIRDDPRGQASARFIRTGPLASLGRSALTLTYAVAMLAVGALTITVGVITVLEFLPGHEQLVQDLGGD